MTLGIWKKRTGAKYGCLSETAGDSTKDKLKLSMHISARRRQKRIKFWGGGILATIRSRIFCLNISFPNVKITSHEPQFCLWFYSDVNLLSHFKGITQVEGVGEEDADDNT